MSKTTRRLRPKDIWRIGEHESWFMDMAAKGLHLQSLGRVFAKFSKGEPKKTRYRIDLSFNKSTILEQREFFAEGGWEFVTNHDEFNVYSSPYELEAPELHTDPAEQAYSLMELQKKFKRDIVILMIYIATLILVLSTPFWLTGGTPILSLVEGTSPLILLIFLVCYMLYSSIHSAISLNKLCKRMIEGKPINHHAPWKKQHVITSTIALIDTIAVIFVVLTPFIQIAMTKTHVLPEAKTDLPIVRLAEIENNPELIRRDSLDQDREINIYTKKQSFLAPIQYQTHEYGEVPNRIWSDGSGRYSPSISSWIYELRYSVLSKGLVSDLVNRYSLSYIGGEFTEIEHPDFDILTVREVDDVVEIFAAKGNAVIHIKYRGEADLDNLINATADNILNLSTTNNPED
jgi:hypothetical protein